ncbi:sigma-70 family RNA polymerase sigma factor [uncultured Dokdonia sp.]|uniref:RNA polymerase sigma factor n=1 Tax=uncultured Dokdonia sp. TaxID=575653 RepID=UPI00260BD447|nr:sigma-70 family RNA polymerase sigma factor [uncultured Dokdonia sp.]
MEKTQLIAGCKKNDLAAQKLLFLKYKDLVYTTSLKYCRNEAEAEDNVHDVFIIIFETIHKYKNKGSFEGWIKRITIHKAVDKFRQRKTTDLPYQIESNTSEVTIDKEHIDIPIDFIFKAIQELPGRYRLVFNLYQLDDYSHKEIAKMLSISVGTSKSNFHRAKQILKEKILAFSSAKILNL